MRNGKESKNDRDNSNCVSQSSTTCMATEYTTPERSNSKIRSSYCMWRWEKEYDSDEKGSEEEQLSDLDADKIRSKKSFSNILGKTERFNRR